MMKRFFLTLTTVGLCVSVAVGPSWGRGFGGGGGRGGGGFGGGGFGGGGFGGGGLGGGGFGGGGFGGGLGGGAGGVSRGGLGGGGFAGGGVGGLGGGGLGGGFDRGGGGFGGAGGLAAGGFGGGGGAMGGSGFGGSGFGGGGFSGGGLGAGGLGGGGLGGGGLGAGGLGGDRFGAGGELGGRGLGQDGFGGQNFSTPSRGQLNSFLGLPSDEGLHSLSSQSVNSFGGGNNFNVNRGVVEGPRGGYAAGATVEGPRGGEAARGVAVGPEGGVAAGRAAVGPGGAAAAQGIAAGPGGRVAGGAAYRGPYGGAGARGFVAGPQGYAAGFARVTPSGRYTTAAAVRGNFTHWGMYGAGWYVAHPGAWYAAGWAAGTAWTAATWASAGAWCGCDDSAPVYYDYGNTVTYQADNVFVNGQDAGTAAQYSDQATALATAGAQAPASSDGDWLPLGVFALCKSDETKSNMTVQLAVDRQGVVRGNYSDTNSITNDTQVIQGSVDKQSQRVAFTIGDNQANVIETGLYNLTKDEAPALIHFPQDRTEQWLLVRLTNKDASTGS